MITSSPVPHMLHLLLVHKQFGRRPEVRGAMRARVRATAGVSLEMFDKTAVPLEMVATVHAFEQMYSSVRPIVHDEIVFVVETKLAHQTLVHV